MIVLKSHRQQENLPKDVLDFDVRGRNLIKRAWSSVLEDFFHRSS